jgi:hypothetical protein
MYYVWRKHKNASGNGNKDGQDSAAWHFVSP